MKRAADAPWRSASTAQVREVSRLLNDQGPGQRVSSVRLNRDGAAVLIHYQATEEDRRREASSRRSRAGIEAQAKTAIHTDGVGARGGLAGNRSVLGNGLRKREAAAAVDREGPDRGVW